MFEKLPVYTVMLRPPSGGQLGLPSSHLRTLAWMRYLLDHLHDVRKHACAEKEGRPPSWERRVGDAAALKKLFEHKAKAPVISEEPRSRVPANLDKVFGTVFAEASSFGDKYVRGKSTPDRSRITQLDDLVPGSAAAFDQPPAPLGSDFYDVLDFQDPDFGTLFVWRALDPNFKDPTWDELADKGWVDKSGSAYRISPRARSNMHDSWAFDPNDENTIHGYIKDAVARILYDRSIEHGEDDRLAHESLDAARAACEAGHPQPNLLAKVFARQTATDIFAGLTNAIAAYRTVVLLDSDDRWYAAWWLRGMLEAAAPHIAANQRDWFCPFPHKAPPLECALKALDLWEPISQRPLVDE
jgi:hypothetical protein